MIPLEKINNLIDDNDSEDVMEAICFALLEFSNTRDFEESKEKGATRFILDFINVPECAKYDEFKIGAVLENLPDNYLSTIAGRPVHKMISMQSAVCI